jgi:recombination protein RecA
MAKNKKNKKKEASNVSFSDIKSIFETKWGKGSIMSLGDDYVINCDVIPSQSISLDYAMGVGGYPRGRIIEIYGPESSGKTSLALHAVASVQNLGGKAAFIDAEHALSPKLMVDMGVVPEETLISQPDSGEQALEMCEVLVASNAVDLVVVDSVAALVPQAELEGDINDNKIGAQARMMSQFLRRIASKVKKSKTAVIFINQIRNKIGVMFGSNETTPGGNALKFYASVRLDIRKAGMIKDGETNIGHNARIKVVKNKVANPFKIAEVPLIWGKGIDYIADLISVAEKHEIVKRSGSWYSYGEERLGMGIQAATEFLRENEKVLNSIDGDVREMMSMNKNTVEDDQEAEKEIETVENTEEE